LDWTVHPDPPSEQADFMQIAAEDNKKNDQRRADGARINRRGEISALLADYGRFYPQR